MTEYREEVEHLVDKLQSLHLIWKRPRRWWRTPGGTDASSLQVVKWSPATSSLAHTFPRISTWCWNTSCLLQKAQDVPIALVPSWRAVSWGAFYRCVVESILRAHTITKDQTNPTHNLFHPLPSGRRLAEHPEHKHQAEINLLFRTVLWRPHIIHPPPHPRPIYRCMSDILLFYFSITNTL